MWETHLTPVGNNSENNIYCQTSKWTPFKETIIEAVETNELTWWNSILWTKTNQSLIYICICIEHWASNCFPFGKIFYFTTTNKFNLLKAKTDSLGLVQLRNIMKYAAFMLLHVCHHWLTHMHCSHIIEYARSPNIQSFQAGITTFSYYTVCKCKCRGNRHNA